MISLIKDPTVIRTICLIALLLVLILWFRLCNAHPVELIRGLSKPALKELSLKGGPTAVANIILCAFGCVVVIFICFPKHLFRSLAILDNAADRDTSECILVGALLFFFVWSLHCVRSIDEYKRKVPKR